VKLLIISSFHSALQDSMINKKWQPKGMPSFSRLIERLDSKGVEFDVVFLAHDSKVAQKKEILKIEGISGDFMVLPLPRYLSGLMKFSPLHPLAELLKSISQGIDCLKLYFNRKYDLIYCDRANVMIGAFFVFFLKAKVFLRLHGVISLFDQFSNPWIRLKYFIKYLSFKAPFKYIVCSEDGSQARPFLERFISKKVPYQILLNGMDMPLREDFDPDSLHREYDIPKDTLIILFVGRLEKSKGGEEFIRSMIKLKEQGKDFYAFLVGQGCLFNHLASLIAENKLSDKITLVGGLKHRDVYKYYAGSDIYTSLNYHGNISNTTLEALYFGKCI